MRAHREESPPRAANSYRLPHQSTNLISVYADLKADCKRCKVHSDFQNLLRDPLADFVLPQVTALPDLSTQFNVPQHAFAGRQLISSPRPVAQGPQPAVC